MKRKKLNMFVFVIFLILLVSSSFVNNEEIRKIIGWVNMFLISLILFKLSLFVNKQELK